MVDTDDPQPTMIVLLAIKSAETIIIVENGSLIRSLESRSRLEEYLADRKVKECDQASNKIVIECMRSLTLVRRITTALYILCHKRLVENKVPETISQKSATAIGLGAIIGAGIFVLSGTAIALAGSYALVSFVLVGIIALIVALELGELGSIMPQEKGASYSYVRGAFGSELGFITGLLLYFSYVSSIPVIALGFGAYLATLTGLDARGFQTAFALVLIGVLAVVNMLGVSKAARTELGLVVFKVCILLLFIGFGIVFTLNHNFANYSNFVSLPQQRSLQAVFSASVAVFFAYAGFQSISTITPEVKGGAR